MKIPSEILLDAIISRGMQFFVSHDEERLSDRDFPDDLMYGFQGHPQTEIILPLAGQVKMFINNEWRLCSSTQPWVMTPMVRHAEYYHLRKEGYQLLWCCLMPNAMNLHITVYEPGRGFFLSPKRNMISSPYAEELWELSNEKGFSGVLIQKAHFTDLTIRALRDFVISEETERLSTVDYHDRIIEQIKQYVRHRYREDITIDRLADMVRYSAGHLNVLFREKTGMPLHQFLIKIRMESARRMLEVGDMLIRDVSEKCGFRDQLYFSKVFRKSTGMGPAQYLKEYAARAEKDHHETESDSEK